MKTLFLFLSIFAVSIYCPAKDNNSNLNVTTQCYNSPMSPHGEYLGIWCYLDITQEDINMGRTRYTISVPPEGLARGMNPIGPGMPHFDNHLGDTVDIVWMDLYDFLPDLHFTNPEDAVITIPVQKWVKWDGSYTTNGYDSNIVYTCYYHCVIRLPQGIL